jgi:hypothetical protein
MTAYVNTFRIEGEIGATVDSGAALLWGGGNGDIMLELAGVNECRVENIVFNAKGFSTSCVWLHSNQVTGGVGTSGCAFRQCNFSDVGGGTVAFLVGDPAGPGQCDTCRWEDCDFYGDGSNPPDALWRTLASGNCKDFWFKNCKFLDAAIGIDWTQASGCCVVESCDGGNFSPTSTVTQAAFVKTDNGQLILDGCEIEATNCRVVTSPDFSGNAGTVVIRGCQMNIAPTDNIFVAAAGSITRSGTRSVPFAAPLITCQTQSSRRPFLR